MNINMLEKEATSSRHSREHKAKHRAHDTDGDAHAERERKHKKRHRHDEGNEGDVGSSKKHRKHHKKDRDKDKTREGRSKEKHHHRTAEKKMDIVDDNPSDDNMWVENDIGMDGERVLATDIPTAESLKIRSTAEDDGRRLFEPSTASTIQRDDWMMLPPSAPTMPEDTRPRTTLPTGEDEDPMDGYGDDAGDARNLGGGVDFFSSLGTERRKTRPDKPDPEKPKISRMELNVDLKNGVPIDMIADPAPAPTVTPGGPGSQWRMMRLRRVFETAEEEGLPVEQVGVDRFGSLQAFEDAKEERRILDGREGRRGGGGGERDAARGRAQDRPTHFSTDGEKRLMFTDVGGSGASSRSASFRRPGGAPATPSPAPDAQRTPANRRLDALRLPSQANSPLAQAHTPIPSVMTPPLQRAGGAGAGARGMSPSSLNKLQAKVIRAKLMDSPDAERLEREYEEEARKAQGAVQDGVRTKVAVLPTLDARGKMYDVGHGKEDEKDLPGNRRKKEKHYETHDRKTGEVLRINPDDDTVTLGEMLRQERMGAGMADQKDLDAQYARAVMGDGKFQNDLDYIDDNAEKLGRQKMRSDGMKRQFAVNDYKQTQKALASCSFCYGEDDSPPKAPVIAMGTRVYLSCTLTDELVDGHCLIVPIQHHLNMLEGDDDVWDETRNFMKCLMRMYAEEDKGVVFFETVLSMKKQRHTFIECIPVPWELFDLLPGYFKESILSSEAEWSQHKKLIDFAARPGGFRRAMVPNLPYFMVQFDHKGEKGYGHVIEGAATAQDEDGLEEGEKGGGEFPFYFATEIIGSVLELEARQWRRPRKVEVRKNKERVEKMKKKYSKFDWTGML